MTFSTQAIVDAANASWMPVWESVGEVRTVAFDLGNGEELTGTISGEIALFFCRPDGVVFDVLPGLQSPASTLAAMEDALAFYRETGATTAATAERHRTALAAPGALSVAEARAARDEGAVRRTRGRREDDPATRDMAEMAFSKVILVTPAEEVTVIEPGGAAIFKTLVHGLLKEGEERTPLGWRDDLFVDVLQQPLQGGSVRYDAYSTGPMSLESRPGGSL